MSSRKIRDGVLVGRAGKWLSARKFTKSYVLGVETVHMLLEMYIKCPIPFFHPSHLILLDPHSLKQERKIITGAKTECSRSPKICSIQFYIGTNRYWHSSGIRALHGRWRDR